MCGRYTLTSQEGLVEELQLAFAEPVASSAAGAAGAATPVGSVTRGAGAEMAAWWRPRWNIAPTQPAPIVPNREGPRHLELARWGLVPPWADSLKGAARLINARAETAATSRAFHDALAKRRCLVPADGFFEWTHARRSGAAPRAASGIDEPKTPFWIHPAPRRPIAFAGIWERWKSPRVTGSGGAASDAAPPAHVWVISFSILTTAANALVAPLHDRMPVVLAPADYTRWLDPAAIDPRAFADLLVPASADGWTSTEVTPRINRPDFDEPF